MLCASNDLLLQGLAQITEVIAVSGHTDNETTILFRVLLCRAQGSRVDYVELNVVSIQFEVGTDQLNKFIESLIICQHLGCELLIEQCAAGSDVIHLGHRTHNGGRPTAVRALDRRDALRKRSPGSPPVGGCSC